MVRVFLPPEILAFDSVSVSRGQLIEDVVQQVTRFLGREILANRPGQYVFVIQNG